MSNYYAITREVYFAIDSGKKAYCQRIRGYSTKFRMSAYAAK
jgi:hypothetical protein